MSLLDPERWGDPDEFSTQYGDDAPTLEQIRNLQVLARVLMTMCVEGTCV